MGPDSTQFREMGKQMLELIGSAWVVANKNPPDELEEISVSIRLSDTLIGIMKNVMGDRKESDPVSWEDCKRIFLAVMDKCREIMEEN